MARPTSSFSFSSLRKSCRTKCPPLQAGVRFVCFIQPQTVEPSPRSHGWPLLPWTTCARARRTRADCSICDRAVTLRAVGTLLLKALWSRPTPAPRMTAFLDPRSPS
jgi:hypothetical protein